MDPRETRSRTIGRKVYIAGKISGLPEAEYKAKFAAAVEKLKTGGFTPVNPLEIVLSCESSCKSEEVFEDGSYKHTWDCYMRHDLIELLKCDSIYLLDNWNLSKGACIEVSLASQVGIPLLLDTLEGWFAV